MTNPKGLPNSAKCLEISPRTYLMFPISPTSWTIGKASGTLNLKKSNLIVISKLSKSKAMMNRKTKKVVCNLLTKNKLFKPQILKFKIIIKNNNKLC